MFVQVCRMWLVVSGDYIEFKYFNKTPKYRKKISANMQEEL
jgi:hypothetical protein